MSDEKALATVSEKAVSAFSGNVTDFETAQRLGKVLAESDLVPTNYKGKLANCLVALEVAHRSGSSVLAVMQNLNIIHGKPSWSSQYIIATVNASGRYTPLRFVLGEDGEVKVGDKKVKNLNCYATATDKKTGEILKGPTVSIETAVKEGWYTKTGSKWPSMPELMLQYRAATFFGRLHCPELLLGMKTEEEMRDVGPEASPATSAKQNLNERIRKQKISDIEIVADESIPEGEAHFVQDGKTEVVVENIGKDEGLY